MHPDVKLYVMPVKSGHIGEDLTSFVLSSSAIDQDERLGLDLGANGKLFLGDLGARLPTCWAAASTRPAPFSPRA